MISKELIEDILPERKYYDDSKYSGQVEYNKGFNDALDLIEQRLKMVEWDEEKIADMFELAKVHNFEISEMTPNKTFHDKITDEYNERIDELFKAITQYKNLLKMGRKGEG